MPLFARAYGIGFSLPFQLREGRLPSVGDFGSPDSVRVNPLAERGTSKRKGSDNALGANGYYAANLQTLLDVARRFQPAWAVLGEDERCLAKEVQSLSWSSFALLAALYHSHDGSWVRLDRVGASRSEALELEGRNLAAIVSPGRSNEAVQIEDVEKLFAKREIGPKRKRVATVAGVIEATGCQGLCCLKRGVCETVLRIHRAVLGLSGYLPEEAACLLAMDWRTLRFPAPEASGKGIAMEEASPDLLDSFCKALNVADELTNAILVGHRDVSMRMLHEASLPLLDGNADRECSQRRGISVGDILSAKRVCGRALMRGISLLERERNYDAAVHYLTIAVEAGALGAFSDAMLGDARVRLVTDLTHLGRKEEALVTAESALSHHPGMPTQYRVQLERILQRLAQPPRRWKKPSVLTLRKAHDEEMAVPDWRQTRTSVEEAVLAEYRHWGWEGRHVENGVFLALVPLLFGECLFREPASPLADYPLGSAIPDRCQPRVDEVERMNPEQLESAIQSAMQCAGDSLMCRGLRLWPKLPEVAACLGGKVIAGACRVLLEDWDANAGGFPDLLLWDRESQQSRLVEVKGPGDALSAKQLVALDRLLRDGADARVCRARPS